MQTNVRKLCVVSVAESSSSLLKHLIGVLAIVLIAMVMNAVPAAAQATSGVTGVVTDPSGAVVIGATVTLSNQGIGYTATTKTNEVGVYEFVDVPPSEHYAIAVSKQGFRDVTLSNVVLNVGTKATQDVKLTIGATQVNVEVTSRTGETLNTTDASIGSVIDADRVQDLPNIFVNNATNYLSLAPGVTPGGAVTGTRSDETNMTVDGLDVNDQRGGFAFTPSVNVPLDSVQELKATVTGDDATYGHSSGGQLEVATKSGTNAFHGQAFELNRVTAYAANNYFNNLQGIPEPALIRNQFGGNFGGPIRKDKLFFFFSYDGLRAKQSSQNNITVPDQAFYNGEMNYVNASGNIVTTPASGPNSLASLDPQGIGADQALLSFLQTRGYPLPNNNSSGDGLNTGGFFFVSPVNSNENTFNGRLDYQATTNHRLFVRATWDRSSDDDSTNRAIQVLPGDPAPGGSIVDHSRAWVGGDTWTISPTIVNQASFGETDQVIAFALNYNPTSPDFMSFNDPFFGNVVTSPFLGLNQQFPVVPVYQGRDTLTWTKKNHTLQFGGVISPIIFKSGNLTDTNTYGIGLGGNLTGLDDPQRPSDFAGDSGEWDRVFALALGRLQGVQANYNYDVAGNALPQGLVSQRDYHSTQYEFFAQDTWNVRSNVTVTYGVRWNFHNPLSEVNGFEAVPNLGPSGIFPTRLQDAAQGISGPDAIPFITYGLGGSANNGPGYYHPDYKNFAPRVSVAYSPDSNGGFLGRLFGNRETSVRAGFGIDYDNNLIGQGFELDETSFMFSNTVPINNGDIATDPRFTCASPCVPTAVSAGLHASQAVPAGGTTPRPTFTPNLDANGFPIGFFNGGFGQGAFFNFDPNFKTPYEMHFSFGIQRQLPGDWLVEATYVGKLGRRLTALGDPAQTLNFVDQNPAGGFPTGQSLYDAFGAVQKQVQAGATSSQLTPQPWFENEVSAALAQTFGAGSTCQNTLGISCTQVAYILTGSGFYFGDGDVSSMVQSLADYHGLSGVVQQGLLLPNVSLLAQNGAAGYIGNYSSSNYSALIIRVNHKFSHDLTMEANYTYSHSIDNDSGVQNNLISFAGSEICDLRDLRVCRGSSDFDHRHLLSANFVYGLPFGRGKWLGSNMPRLLDEAVGGWRFSGIVSAYSGSPFKVDSGAFTIDFTQTQPGVFIGNSSDVAHSVHQVSSGIPGVPNTVQFFSNVNNAQGAFTFPIAGGPGNRNVVDGPGFWNVDMAILKDFAMPWSDSQKLQLRADAFNIFNHTNFSSPDASLLDPATFGNITSTANDARQLQLGLKYSF
ncbi:MAG TPA: TonB-dependent receptor [Candidatus Acidoferrales bacterium]|nr:TonB-dependent receptor [Candidatus Acidoferrales bacterium]